MNYNYIMEKADVADKILNKILLNDDKGYYYILC